MFDEVYRLLGACPGPPEVFGFVVVNEGLSPFLEQLIVRGGDVTLFAFDTRMTAPLYYLDVLLPAMDRAAAAGADPGSLAVYCHQTRGYEPALLCRDAFVATDLGRRREELDFSDLRDFRVFGPTSLEFHETAAPIDELAAEVMRRYLWSPQLAWERGRLTKVAGGD